MFDKLKNLFQNKSGSCAHRTDLTPEEDIAIAETEYVRGDLVHAAYHTGCALSRDPNRKEWRAVLEKISDVAPDPLQLAPVGEKNYFATMAVRAYLLHRLNRRDQALELLYQTVVQKPDVPYLDWAIEWLFEPDQPIPDPKGAGWFLAHLITNWEELSHTPDAQPTIERIPRLIEAYWKAGLRDPQFLFAAVGVMRRKGPVRHALGLAREAYRLAPAYHSAIALANVLKQDGDIPGAVNAFQEALRYEPDDLAARLDLGDTLWDQGDLSASARWYYEVLQREPEHPWALPSYLGVGVQLSGDSSWDQRLLQYAEAHPDNQRAAFAMGRCMSIANFLADPTEATVNVARQVIERAEGDPAQAMSGKVSVTINYLEPPSAIMAVRQAFQLLDPNLQMPMTVETIQQPDPRQVQGRPEWVLWRYSGVEAKPTLPPPDPDVYERIVRLATAPYRLTDWRDQGRTIARELNGATVEHILPVMVHPGAPPAGMRPWTWLYRLQVATALVLAGLDEGWEGSLRRRALLALAAGPMDWSINAAVIALATLWTESPAAEAEIAEVYRELYRRMPQQGAVCYLDVLCQCALMRPNPEPGERGHWEEALAALRRAQ